MVFPVVWSWAGYIKISGDLYENTDLRVHLVQAMVFLVVMYGCESWTIKKAECRKLMLLNCVFGEDS